MEQMLIKYVKAKCYKHDEDKPKDNTICIINIKDKDKSEYIDENILTKVYTEEEKKVTDNNNWTQEKLSRYFGIIIQYLKYVRIGYFIVITMHT